MSKEFEKWVSTTSATGIDFAEAAFTTGRALGRREMKREATESVELESEHSAPCWCEDAEDGFPPKVCDCCNFIANLAERIEAIPDEG